MPRVFRQQYTRPIPPDAVRVTIKGKKGKPDVPGVRFKDSDGATVIVPLTKKGDRCRVASPVWYGQYTDAIGDPQRVPLCENKVAAEQMLNEFVKKAERGRAGLGDPHEDHKKRRLTEHLVDWEKVLHANGNTPRHVKQAVASVRSILDGCKFTFWNDLSGSRVQEFLADLGKQGRSVNQLDPAKEIYTKRELATLLQVTPSSLSRLIRQHKLLVLGNGKARRFPKATAETLVAIRSRGRGVRTCNYYLAALKTFVNWMVKDRRAASNPIDYLSDGNEQTDRRHDRRELEIEELRRLLTATRESVRSFRGLTGPDRYHLYATACGTGFRALGLASLTPESFDLAGDKPVVTLAARKNKNRKLKVQPIPPDLAQLLRDYLKDRPAGQPIWPGKWASDRRGGEMLHLDLDSVGIPYSVEGPDGPLFADFHALRHTYLTLGSRAGIDLRTLQELAGHSTPTLTARYSHRRLHDLAGAVEKLPDFLPREQEAEQQTAILKATGTDPNPMRAYTPLTQTSDGRASPVMVPDGEERDREENTTGPNHLQLQGVEARCEPLMATDGSRAEKVVTSDCLNRNQAHHQQNRSKNSGSAEDTSALTQALHNSTDSGLSRVVEAWDRLPLHIRTSILALVDASR